MLPTSEPPQQVHVPSTSPVPSSSRVEDDISKPETTEDSEQVSPQMPRLKPQTTPVSIPIETVTNIDEISTNNDNSPSTSSINKNTKCASKTIEKSNPNVDNISKSNKSSNSTITSKSPAKADNIDSSSVRPKLSLGKTLGSDYKCEDCGDGFGNRGSLVIHRIRKHNFQTESMKAKRAQSSSASPKRKNKRLSGCPKSRTTKSASLSPIKKPEPAVKSPVKSSISPDSNAKKPPENSLNQAASSINQQKEVLWYENDSHECEICFRVLRSWTKFVEHSKTLHDFYPKPPPPPETAPEETSEPDKDTPSTPQQNETETIVENIQSEVVKYPTGSTTSSSPLSEKKFECPVCNLKFKKKIGLNIHCRNQHDKHVCSECNDYFDSRDDLEIHMLTHELQEQLNNRLNTNVSADADPEKVAVPSKPPIKAREDETASTTKFECLYCDSSYTQKPKLSLHYTDKHKLYFCTICFNGFKSAKLLDNHKSEDHINNNEQFNDPINISSKGTSSTDNVICKCCKLEFKFRSSLFLHIRQSHNMIPCTLCVSPISEDQFGKHKLDCLDPRLSCIMCKISFKRERSLALHMAREHAPKKVAIVISSDEDDEKEKEKEKQKASKESIRVKNTSKTPFCMKCKKKFDSSSQLWDHLKNIHPADPRYRCSTCQNVFYSSGGLSKHTAKCHNSNSKKNAHDSDSDADEEKESNDNIKNEEMDERQEKEEDEEEDTMICPVSSCRKRFNTTWQCVNRHIKDIHHPSTLKECMYCIKLFVDVEKWKEHEKLHVLIPDEIQKIGNIPLKNAFKFAISGFAEPKHVCKVCTSKFFTLTQLNEHTAAKHEKESERDRERSITPSSDHSVHRWTKSRSKTTTSSTSKRIIQSSSDDDSDSTTFSSRSAKRKKTDLLTSKDIKQKINCKYCPEEFNNFVELLPHIESYHSSSVCLKCENCDEIYYDFGSFNKHTEEAHPKLSLKCTYCHRTFTRAQNKVSHELVCTKRPLDSALSDEESSDSNSSSDSSSLSESVIPCKFCSASFKTHMLLCDHLKEHAKNSSM